MGKAQSIADRLKSAKRQFDADLDDVASTLDKFDALRPQVVGGAKSIVTEMSADANELLNELRQLSNLPFGQKESSSDSEKLVDASKQLEATLPKAGTIAAPAPSPSPLKPPGGAADKRPF